MENYKKIIKKYQKFDNFSISFSVEILQYQNTADLCGKNEVWYFIRPQWIL